MAKKFACDTEFVGIFLATTYSFFTKTFISKSKMSAYSEIVLRGGEEFELVMLLENKKVYEQIQVTLKLEDFNRVIGVT